LKNNENLKNIWKNTKFLKKKKSKIKILKIVKNFQKKNIENRYKIFEKKIRTSKTVETLMAKNSKF
jgi:hypothetical protein